MTTTSFSLSFIRSSVLFLYVNFDELKIIWTIYVSRKRGYVCVSRWMRSICDTTMCWNVCEKKTNMNLFGFGAIFSRRLLVWIYVYLSFIDANERIVFHRWGNHKFQFDTKCENLFRRNLLANASECTDYLHLIERLIRPYTMSKMYEKKNFSEFNIQNRFQWTQSSSAFRW